MEATGGVIALVSGVDSLAAYLIRKNELPGETVRAVYFDYGYPFAEHEFSALKKQCPELERIEFPHFIPTELWSEVIPDLVGRNSLMVSFLAAKYRPREILFGSLPEENDAIYDTSGDWAELQSELWTKSYPKGESLRVHRLLVEQQVTKPKAFEYLRDQGVDLSNIHSCYHGQPCMRCPKCIQMHEASKKAGVKTRYIA